MMRGRNDGNGGALMTRPHRSYLIITMAVVIGSGLQCDQVDEDPGAVLADLAGPGATACAHFQSLAPRMVRCPAVRASSPMLATSPAGTSCASDGGFSPFLLFCHRIGAPGMVS